MLSLKQNIFSLNSKKIFQINSVYKSICTTTFQFIQASYKSILNTCVVVEMKRLYLKIKANLLKITDCFKWVKVLRSKLKRSTQKFKTYVDRKWLECQGLHWRLRLRLTENDYNFKVDIKDCYICWNFTFAKLYWLLCLKLLKKIYFTRST